MESPHRAQARTLRGAFLFRIPVELEPVTPLEPHINVRHEVFPRLYDALRIGVAHILVLEEFLANPA
jgi:hypothetical protein